LACYSGETVKQDLKFGTTRLVSSKTGGRRGGENADESRWEFKSTLKDVVGRGGERGPGGRSKTMSFCPRNRERRSENFARTGYNGG